MIYASCAILVNEAEAKKPWAGAAWWTDMSFTTWVGGYSSKQVGGNDPLTALFKMTKSILPYWSVILLSFSGLLQTLPSSLHSFVAPPTPPRTYPAAPYWSLPVIGWAVIWDGHWRMSANCFSFSLFHSSRGWWSHNASDRARQGPIAMECWPE